MADPLASPTEVKVEIDTHLADTEINAILGRVVRDIERDDDVQVTDEDRKDLEAVLAAHHIATTRERASERVSTGGTTVTYEQSMIDELKARARRLGATDELLGIGATKPTASIAVPKTRE